MSTATRYDRWYILPAIVVGSGEGAGLVPKYVYDNPDIDGHSGTIVGRDALTAYAGLLQQFGEQDDWYISRLYATGNAGWNALNAISANYQDTRTLATNRAFVGEVLSQRLNTDRTTDEWEQSFRIGRAAGGGEGA